MPINRKCSIKAFNANIRQLKGEGMNMNQALAISYKTLRESCGVPEDSPRMSPDDVVKQGKGEGGTPHEVPVIVAGNPVHEDRGCLSTKAMIESVLGKKA